MWFYVIVFWILVAAISLYFWLAKRFEIIDQPNERSSHSVVTIRGGGIIFPFAYLLYLTMTGNAPIYSSIGILLISVVSFLDDVRPLSNRFRLAFHFLCVGLVFYDIGWFEKQLFVAIAALVVGVGIVNAYNFMDGINGIHGIYSLAVLGGIYVSNHLVGAIDREMLHFMLLALVVFGIYNFRAKAKCFAGDVGSICVALFVIYCLLALIDATGDYSYLLFLLVYGVDAVFTILRRLHRGENIFRAHRTHLYQYLANELQVPHLAVSIGYGVMQLLISALLIGNQSCWHLDPIAFFVLVTVALVGFYLLFKAFVLARVADARGRQTGVSGASS